MKHKNKQESDPEIIWIIGGGKFGKHAAVRLWHRAPHAEIIMVDREEIANPPKNLTFIRADGVAWLADNLTPDSGVSKIIPALPLHLAVDWLQKILPEQGLESRLFELPDGLLAKLPHPIRQSPSRAVLSHADFICPESCSEPAAICTHTGKTRPPELFKLIGELEYPPFKPLVLRSRQFAAGVGGFLPGDLWDLCTRVISAKTTPLLIGTACKCHGIIDGLTIKPR